MNLQASRPNAAPLSISCGPTPSGTYVVRFLVAVPDGATASAAHITCEIDGDTVGERSQVVRAGFHVLECAVKVARPGELCVNFAADSGAPGWQIWPPASPMVAAPSEGPPPSGLLPLVEHVRAWSAGAASPYTKLKQLVFDEIYHRVEHRPALLAVLRWMRRTAGRLLGR
jgi:hypothetical protein